MMRWQLRPQVTVATTQVGARLSLAALILIELAGCEPLGTLDDCAPCATECPGELECKDHVCVRPGQEGLCGADDSTLDSTTSDTNGGTELTSSSAGGSGEGNMAGADGGSGDGNVGGHGSVEGSGGVPAMTTSHAGTGEAGAAGVSNNCDPPPGVCVPENTNLPRLAAVCGNRPFSRQLEARCACDPASQEREMVWHSDDLPAGLSLSEHGELSGTLAPGSYTFSSIAYVDGHTANIGHFEHTLEVLDRCLVTFLSEDESAGVPRVAAVRVDTLAVEGWMPATPDVAVDRYDISSDGSYLAAVVDEGDSLELFALAQPGVPGLEFEHEGLYVAHAFSPDADRLAVVTTDPSNADTQLLHLMTLDGAGWQLVDVIADVSFVADLDWFGNDRVLYLGKSGFYGLLAPFWTSATDDGFSDAVEVFDARVDPYDIFDGFLTHDSGFFSASQFISGYVGLDSQFTIFLYPFTAVSPSLSYRAKIDSDVLVVAPMTWSDVEPPYALAQGCEELRAWSHDDTTLLCRAGSGYSVFEIHGNDDLRRTELEGLGASVWPNIRAALSVSGSWLALLRTDTGLYVVPKSSYAQAFDEPLLDPLIGGWDFFFTPSERQVVIQQGDRLLVGQLDAEAPVEPHEVDVTMGPVAQCQQIWSASDPSAWCGAPTSASNTILSSDERFLAARDVNRSVVLIPLDTLEPQRLGALSASCAESCIQFQ